MKTIARSPRAQRGSLLIVAMILCAVIGISIASYLALGRTGMEISNRALYNNAAMNLAENGLEHAVHAINKTVADPTYSWTGNSWTVSGSNAYKKWTGYNFDQGVTGEVRAYVYNYSGSAAPKVVTRSIVTLGGSNSRTIEKWVEVQLRKTSKFSNGLVAKDQITFSGNNATVNSWNSDPDNDGADIIPYSDGVKKDNGSVGSISVAVDAILINNADIFGYASTGGAQPQVGSKGLVGTYGPPQTAAGTVVASRVSTDFAASFDPVSNPTTGTTIDAIEDSDLPTSLGTAGSTTTWRLPSISSAGNNTKVLTIEGDVTIVLTAAPGSTAISLTGNASISIASGASLKIYTEGNVDIAGNGVANGGTTAATANQPIDFQIWGTSTSTTHDQTIAIKGNGVLSGVVYAPNATVTINGNGDVLGSVVAEDISLTGNATFHYDESLANFGGNNPYRVSMWKELSTESQRAGTSYSPTYSSALNF